jgi:cytochrome c-type biogenesis protein CcmH
MMSLWLSFGALFLLAVFFIAWPLWRYGRSEHQSIAVRDLERKEYLAKNVQLYREHLAELEASHASNAIDAEQFAQLKLELERNLLDDETSLQSPSTVVGASKASWVNSKAAIIFSALILVAGVLLYHKIGGAQDLNAYRLQQEKMELDFQDMSQNRKPDPVRTRALITEYKERLSDNPDSIQYRFLLARSLMGVNEYADAAKAYQQVLEKDATSPMIMAELAQAIFLRDGNQMSPPVIDLCKKAVSLDPENTMALSLLGANAYAQKNYREAIQYWKKTIDLLGPDSPSGRSLSAGIERAAQDFVAAGGKIDDLLAKSAYTVQVSVSLGDTVKATPDQIVFIYARAWQGSPMPLAIARVKVSELPTTVMLDETMAMSPMASLATATDIEVVARVSTDGTAQTKAGDWQAKQGPISMKAVPEKIELLVNEQVKVEAGK